MDDTLAEVQPLLEIAGDWHYSLTASFDEEQMKVLRKHESTGRPMGTVSLLDRLESVLDRTLKR